MLNKTLAIILAGGNGTRLHPLTEHRTKPAVPFGGNYRIIDFTLTNCLHSGLRQILVLTQYKSHSLQKHLRDGWSIFNPELGEFITPVPPQMRVNHDWYAGTADAIYQNLYMLERSDAEQILILSGDHIYRMDYAEMLKAHQTKEADLTVACMEVDLAEARDFGVMSVDTENRITSFTEKPAEPEPLPDNPDRALASMGIYIFRKEFLLDVLETDSQDANSSHDFGKDLLPRLLQNHRVFAHRFGGEDGRVTPDRYWRDVGSLDSYYQANMALLEPVPPMDLYQEDWNIRGYQAQNPPARTVPGPNGTQGVFINSIVASGCIIAGGGVHHSILFPQVRVEEDAMVEDAILFDGVKIGAGAKARNCIIDKGVEVPDGEQIGFDLEKDRARFTISNGGVVAIPQGYQFS